MAFHRAKPELRGGYYLEISADESFVAVGFWNPNKEDLLRIRKEIEIDLHNQIIFVEDNEIAHFEIDPFRKKCILEGLDEIGLSLTHSSEIKEFERKHCLKSPWIFNKNSD